MRGAAFAETLSLRELSRAWQMLVKGIQEVALAAQPLAAAEMVLVRLCHAADLPTPDEAIRMLAKGMPGAPRLRDAPSRAAPKRASPRAADRARRRPGRDFRRSRPRFPLRRPSRRCKSFEDVIARAKAERDRLLVFALERHVRPIRFEQGRIEIALTPAAERDLPQKLMAALKAWTGERWMVTVTTAEGGETAHEARAKSEAALFDEASADPLVRQVLERFPGAEIVGVRERITEPDDAADAIDAESPDAADADERRGSLMKDFMGMMKQAAALQEKMQSLQAEIAALEAIGTAGAGLVTVTVNGKGGLKNVKIDPSLAKPEEIEILEDLIVAAAEDARGKAEALAAEKMKALTAGLPLPPGLSLPF